MQEAEEVRLVRALAENPAANVDYGRTFKGLEEQQLRRKDKHDAALHQYQQQLAAFSEQLEEEVLARSRDVREALAQNDEQIEKLAATMRDDTFLLTLEMDAVKALSAEAHDMIARRREVVADFKDKLEGIELNRSRTIEGMLKELTRELTTIAHRLRPDIEEIVESEAFELNTVMTANRQTYAELTTRMEKQVIDKYTMLESEWATCMQQWRTLMHNRELERVLAQYSSPDVVDPPERNAYLQDLQVTRTQLLDSRKQLMEKLAVMDMASIASEEVKAIAAGFEELNASELRQIRQWYEGVTFIRQQVEESMVSVREALRLQLHTFGALKPEPPLAVHAAHLQQFIDDAQLADLYRKAGGLKAELSQLLRELCDPGIAYHAVLAAAQERTQSICAGFDLIEVLDRQGKSSVRDVLRSTNDKVRGTPKAEVLLLLPMLKKQIVDLAEVQDIDEHCRELLLSCAQDINTVIETAEDLRTADEEIRTSTGTTTGRSKVASTVGTSRTSTRRSRKSAKPTLTETIAPEEDDHLKVDMVTLRTAQKQLGMILAVGELPGAIKDEVRSICSSLVQQRECNEVVDAAVSFTCDPRIKQTSQHQKQVVEALVLSLERHAEYWTAITTRLCTFYSRLALIREKHAAKMKAIDDENHDMLAVLEFKYGEEVQRLEDLLAGCCQQISYATSDAQLQAEFERALRLLAQLEHFYHHHHSVACFAADIQPVATTKAAHQLLKSVCDAFHLVPPSEHVILNNHRQTRSDAQRLNYAFLEAAKSPAQAQAQVDSAVNDEPQAESQGDLDPDASGDPEEYRALDPPVELMNRWLAVDSSVYADSTLLECWSSLQSSATFEVPPAAGSDPGAPVSYGVLVPLAGATAELLALTRATNEEGAADEAQPPRTFATFYSALREETLAAYPEFETSGCSWWQPSFRVLSEEELQEAQPSDVMASLAGAFLVLHESELQSLSIPEQRAYTAAKSFVQAIQDGDLLDKPSTAEERLARYLRLPLKPDGAPFLPQIIPSAADVEETLSRAASSFLAFVQADSARNYGETAAVSKDRKHKLTELLEEMIRTHWPRRGEIETTIVQQREGELIAHYQRLARHQQLIQAKAAALEENFQRLVSDARVQCDDFVNALAAVRSKLAEQITLAGVQGLELRGKKLNDEFMADCETRLAVVSTYLEEEPDRLKATNHEMLRGCKAFDEGGNYSEPELDDVRNALQALDELIENAAQARQQRITELREQQQQTAAGANDFWTQCKQVAQDLALSEGLGQKYGAPRRAAQERIRTEVTRDENAAGQIDEWLAALEFECSEVEWYLRIYDGTDDGNTKAASNRQARQSGAATAALHELVRNRLIQIRAAVQHRVRYLAVEAGSSPANATDGKVAWAEGAEEPPPIEHPCNSEPKPFAAAIEAAQEECKANTVQLYKAEGKADLISRGGQTVLPDALARWLEEMSNKLLGRDGYKDRASERLMGQLARLDRLWGREFMTKGITVQAVVFRDIYLSASTAFKANAEGLEKQFSKSLKAWELGRQKHERVLRPHLSTPEGEEELATLCEMEAARSKELCHALVAFRRDLFAAQFQLAQQFVIDVHNVATGLLLLLDSTVSALPKQQLPPEGEEASTQRKSYKRLRKVQRLKQEALKARESSSASGSRAKAAAIATAAAASSAVPLAQLVAERKRTWPSLELEAFVTAIQEADLACLGEDSTASGSATAQSSFEQQYSAWMAELAESSRLVSLVTPAHRTLFRERDLACSAFLQHVLVFSRAARVKYADLLQQERNWQERWTRQVDLLKSNEAV